MARDTTTAVKDNVCKAITLWLLTYGSWVIYGNIKCYEQRVQENPAPYEAGRMPIPMDFLYAILAALGISVIRHYSYTFIFQPLSITTLDNTNKSSTWSKEERAEKEFKWGTACFKFFYMLAASIGGYYVLQDVDWLPQALGGRHEVPFGLAQSSTTVEITRAEKVYYLIEMGYAIHSLGLHLASTPTNDFWDMGVHHLATLLLEMISYSSGMFRVGMLVLLLHDFTDIFVYALKMAVDGASIYTTLACYFTHMFAWGYFRMWVFPQDVIEVAITGMVTKQEFYGCNGEAVVFLCIMLVVLLALHWWWYYLFVIIFIHFARSGKGRDLTAKTKADEAELDDDLEGWKQKEGKGKGKGTEKGNGGRAGSKKKSTAKKDK